MSKKSKLPRLGHITPAQNLRREINIIIHDKVRNFGKVMSGPMAPYLTPKLKRQRLEEVKSMMRAFLKRHGGVNAPLPRV
jgi:hypothetical protein